MSRAQGETVIKSIIREVVQECAVRGESVPETLVSFMVCIYVFALWLNLHSLLFTMRCTLVQSTVLGSHVVCPSVRSSDVRLSLTLVDCDHIGWNSSKIISRLAWGVRCLQTQTSWIYSKGSNRKFGPKVTHPLLI